MHSQVERAFTLWKNGDITLESLNHSARRPAAAIKKKLNAFTGKASTKTTDFTRENWGQKTDKYVAAISLTQVKDSKALEGVIEAAQQYVVAKDFKSRGAQDQFDGNDLAVLFSDSDSQAADV